MSKETSTIIKGIAILMMLFLHLFNGLIFNFHPELQELPYQPLCYINNQPLEYIITRFCRPVPFFFILSGYGISYLHSNNKLSYRSQFIRLSRIFTAYWMTMILFVSIGHLMGYENYPGSIRTFLENASSYSDSYNLSMWFLFPYTIISLFSPLLLKIIENYKKYILAIITTGLLYGLTGFTISRYIDKIGYSSLLGHLLQCIQYIFPFTCGIILHKSNFLHHPKWQYFYHHKIWSILLLFIVIVLKSFLDSQAFDTLFALAFIMLFVTIQIHQFFSCLLFILGKYSMVIWMVHMYLSHYFFTSFIYGFHYPFLIFTMLLICSFLISFVVTHINEKIHFIILQHDK